MDTSISPVEQRERAVIIDVLRGFALLGVIVANFTSFTDQQVPEDILMSISSSQDKMLMHINTVFFEWKFMTLFSILFGYGFGLLLASIEKKNINSTSFFLKRMFWLFLIGVIHTSFWWFDVLHFYAICGGILLCFRKLSTRVILICSILCMFVLPFCLSFALRNQPDTLTDSDWLNVYLQFKHGNILNVFKTNIIGYYKLFILSASDLHDIIETLGRFLFGFFLLRINLFNSIENKKPLFLRFLFISLPFALFYFVIKWMAVTNTIKLDSIYWKPLIKIGIFSATCMYTSLIVLLFILSGNSMIFKIFQTIGKMTLTNYLLVSTVMIVILYGIGFGQLGELSMHQIWLCALGWLVIEILFSYLWLTFFRYGPIEWLWRQLTYWKRLPIRK